jgi:hypothetical protein
MIAGMWCFSTSYSFTFPQSHIIAFQRLQPFKHFLAPSANGVHLRSRGNLFALDYFRSQHCRATKDGFPLCSSLGLQCASSERQSYVSLSHVETQNRRITNQYDPAPSAQFMKGIRDTVPIPFSHPVDRMWLSIPKSISLIP